MSEIEATAEQSLTSAHGHWLWYELLTNDAAGAKAFYEAVVGWTVELGTQPPLYYGALLNADGGMTGGLLPISPEMAAQGARPGWLGYIGVREIDAGIAHVQALGGGVVMPRVDMDGIGSFALVHDADGALFYLMTPAGEGKSTAFDPPTVGRGAWNELCAGSAEGALSFYTALFGWDLPPPMDMGPMGQYNFIARDKVALGAIMQNPVGEAPPHWNVYFRVANIDAAAAAIGAHGGTLLNGPHQVPGGDWIVHGRDPQGAFFCLVGARPA